MIHDLLHLTRSLFVFDVETTGLDHKTDRIIEIGFQQWTADGMIKEWRSLVNPGVPISEGAAKAHGISNDRLTLCNKCASTVDMHPIGLGDTYCGEFRAVPTFKQLAPNLAKGFVDCDYAGKNVRFDLRMLDAEMKRSGVAWSYAGARIIDADRLEQLGEPRTLSDLYKKHLGKEPEGAHQALADVRMTTEVIEAQLRKYQMPISLDALHELQWPGWLDSEGSFRMVNGVPTCMFGKWRGRPMRAIDRGYWDYILTNSFPSDVKALASAAKLGKFPEG